MSSIRLDKFLADAGVETRSRVREILKKGLVTLNGEIIKKGDRKVDPDTDVVMYKGSRVIFEEFRYFMLHKPAGVITATEDKSEETVMDLLKGENLKDLFPVGRLDKDTEGLLLITNDGSLAHRLLSPKHHADKTYLVKTDGHVTDEDIELLEKGIDIGDEKPTLPATVQRAEEDAILLTIHEGRYHQVKRMLEAVGKPVVYLKRLSMGGLVLDEKLEKGKYRRLETAEIELLKNNW